MKGICRLTHKEADLRHSHIYPKFVINWMKDTGSPYLRNLSNPNLRFQDGYKKHLLSQEAEQLFSEKEKWFAENVFHPYLNDPATDLKYDDNLFYFSISMLWRILILELDDPTINTFRYYEQLIEAEAQWRTFLQNKTYPKNYDRILLILTGRIRSHDITSSNVDYYLTRSADGTIVFNDTTYFCSVYVKFARFIFFGLIQNGDENAMNEVKVNPIGGIIEPPKHFAEPNIVSFFNSRVKQLDEKTLPSEKQQNVIYEDFEKGKGKIIGTDLYESIETDHNLFKRN